MKKKILLIAGLLVALFSRAQVLLTTQLPPLGLTVKQQLWNVSLINTGNENIAVRIEVTITDVATNQLVLTGASRPIQLGRGAKQVRLADVVPVTYTIGSPGYNVDPNPEGFLPTGIFTICYSVIKIYIDAPEILSEECQSLEVEPLSPPQLMIPLDEEDVELMRPLFAWVPPFPVNSYSRLLYDWMLVEVQPTQSPADAIEQNIPVLTRQNISFTNFQYPQSMPELDTVKTYAWRITAKNNRTPIANSEIWSFTLKKPPPGARPVTPQGFFARLHRNEDAAFILCEGILRFEYVNAINEKTVQLNLFDISSNKRSRVPLDSARKNIQFGQNFIQIDLRQMNGMADGHMYLLELNTARNEKGYLKFEFNKRRKKTGNNKQGINR